MEIVYVAPERFKYACMERIKYLMENAIDVEMVVPLVVEADFGKSYAEAK